MRGQTNEIADRSANPNTLVSQRSADAGKRNVVVTPVSPASTPTSTLISARSVIEETETVEQPELQVRDTPAAPNPTTSSRTGKIVAGTIIGVTVLATLGAAAIAVRNQSQTGKIAIDEDDMVRIENDEFGVQTPFRSEALPPGEDKRDNGDF